MANRHCGIFARVGQQTKQVKRQGRSGIVPVEGATCWLRWRDGGKQMYRNVEKTLEIDPNYAFAHVVLGLTYQLQGKYDLWLAEWDKAAALNDDDDDLAVHKAVQAELSQSGYRAALRRMAEMLQQQAKRIYIDPEAIAEPYALMGDKDNAFLWLQKAYSERSAGLGQVKLSKTFDSLRSDPRFADLLRRMNIPQ